jgi:hypothetical protein
VTGAVQILGFTTLYVKRGICVGKDVCLSYSRMEVSYCIGVCMLCLGVAYFCAEVLIRGAYCMWGIAPSMSGMVGAWVYVSVHKACWTWNPLVMAGMQAMHPQLVQLHV